jgi:hypothetical protein
VASRRTRARSPGPAATPPAPNTHGPCVRWSTADYKHPWSGKQGRTLSRQSGVAPSPAHHSRLSPSMIWKRRERTTQRTRHTRYEHTQPRHTRVTCCITDSLNSRRPHDHVFVVEVARPRHLPRGAELQRPVQLLAGGRHAARTRTYTRDSRHEPGTHTRTRTYTWPIHGKPRTPTPVPIRYHRCAHACREKGGPLLCRRRVRLYECYQQLYGRTGVGRAYEPAARPAAASARRPAAGWPRAAPSRRGPPATCTQGHRWLLLASAPLTHA